MNTIIGRAGISEASGARHLVVAATIGNALEFFDFTVYGFFAILIGQLFFPGMSSFGQLLASVSTFGVGFLMRPLGGVVIGAYADRVSRKAAMSLTIFLMAVGCAMIGCAPTYAQIGVMAPVLVVLARLVQGFSAGGEVGASTTLLIERAAVRHRGFLGSWQFASQGLGIAAGAALSATLYFVLSPEDLRSWGWRLPFLAGILIAPIGFVIRQRLEEHSVAPPSDAQAPFVTVAVEHWRAATVGTVLTIGTTVAAYVTTFYMPTYAIRELKLGAPVALLAAFVSGVAIFVISPIAGALSDRFGRKRLILWPRLVMALVIYPAFVWLTNSPGTVSLLITVGGLSALLALQGAPGIALLPELFPKPIRVSGMAIVYSIGVAIFGGFAQTVALWLIHVTGSKLAPAWYLTFCVLLSCLALPFIRETAGADIDAS